MESRGPQIIYYYDVCGHSMIIYKYIYTTWWLYWIFPLRIYYGPLELYICLFYFTLENKRSTFKCSLYVITFRNQMNIKLWLLLYCYLFIRTHTTTIINIFINYRYKTNIFGLSRRRANQSKCAGYKLWTKRK